jgi:ActR/RegA family two-component response regulator
MLRSLLLTSDDDVLRSVARGFKDLQVELDHFSDSKLALSHAAGSRYDAIVVDDGIRDSYIVLAKLIELPSCNKSIRVVLADPTAALNAVFKTGTQVILYKPLTAERVRQGLRAMHNLMAQDRRRRDRRVSTTIPARVSHRHSKGSFRKVSVADISESGAALHSATGDLPSSGILNLEFSLPGSPDLIHATAELVWQHQHGGAGVRFLDMPSHSRKLLAQWLKFQPGEKKAKVLSTHAGA